MAIRITCINKAGGQHFDPHVAISNLGWLNDSTGSTGKSSRIEVYDWLKQSSGNLAYVLDRGGNKAFLYPRESPHGTKFVQTIADKVWTDNLLYLPECVS
jgi:hypothetical protein